MKAIINKDTILKTIKTAPKGIVDFKYSEYEKEKLHAVLNELYSDGEIYHKCSYGSFCRAWLTNDNCCYFDSQDYSPTNK